MQFQVPQFIETEDKIVGPLTLRQFLYLATAGGVSFVFFFFIKTWLWLVTTIFLGAISASFAFLKINGRPVPVLFRAALAYYWKPRLFLWQREKGTVRMELPELESEKKQNEAPGGLLAVGDKLRGLFEKLQTSRAPIPKRENGNTQAGGRAQAAFSQKAPGPKERFEILGKIAGAPQIAKRVDYR